MQEGMERGVCLQGMVNLVPIESVVFWVVTLFCCPLSPAGLSSVAAISEPREHQRGGDGEGPPNSWLGQHC